MSSLKSASVIICICCVACSIIGLLAPLGRMRKISNLVLGAFLVSSLFIPLLGVVDTFSTDYSFDIDDTLTTVSNESDYEKMVLNQTAQNLVAATNDLLLSEGIEAKNIELGIKKSENNSIYINKINIYINKEDKEKTEQIKNIIVVNMSKEPVIIVSE
ncbi:MAG: stage III sporulation protein AF [Eubacteriales bacterium]|nr:stage III sporulation protein AF [Eubacteriales bacterium]